ncbi:hypothetical protein CONLIGDRAFT_214428 [Coniochaeta ligniaria NRRL 30616]|uniref:DDHD domain-containing protein n=1 Tax=Coniochaeta ligniaria NRRL 30616 TaxID=1408157 RepID=A0A1J7JVW5_9PEZI|nr:hypothetical protein CONLIGDRAFT_214428 [Coniochaeta ligniaria NRRL 30616]
MRSHIFHPSDPIAYRLEPLISKAMSSLKPQALPYTKKGIFGTVALQGLTGIGAKVGQSVSGLWSSFSAGIASSLLNRSLGLTQEDSAAQSVPIPPQGHRLMRSPSKRPASLLLDAHRQLARRRSANPRRRCHTLKDSTAGHSRDPNDTLADSTKPATHAIRWNRHTHNSLRGLYKKKIPFFLSFFLPHKPQDITSLSLKPILFVERQNSPDEGNQSFIVRETAPPKSSVQ